MTADVPSKASHSRISETLAKIPAQISTKPDPLNFRPSSVFTCVDMTVKAAAEQNPEMTGAEINSTRNPVSIKSNVGGESSQFGYFGYPN
jgi:uncharacterized OsmC-like protein